MGGTERTLLLVVFVLLVLQGAGFLLRALAAGEDQAPPLIHLISGGLGLALAGLPAVPVRSGLGFGVVFTLPGGAGVLGLARLPWLPLARADHAFHWLLGIAGAAVTGRRQPRVGRP